MPKKGLPDPPSQQRLTDTALVVLERGLEIHPAIEGESYVVRLREQLSRDRYSEVNTVLGRLGGKYQQAAKHHLFPYDPTLLIGEVLKRKVMPEDNPLAFYATPPWLVKLIIKQLLSDTNVRQLLYQQRVHGRQLRILEPSAGLGGIAEALRDAFPGALIHCCELDDFRRSILRAKGFEIASENFFDLRPEYDEERYDIVVLNPPFVVADRETVYIEHVYHAHRVLIPAEESVLMALTLQNFFFRNERVYRDFFSFVMVHGVVIDLPKDTFRESGAGAQTVLLYLGQTILPDYRQLDEPWSGYESVPVGMVMEYLVEETSPAMELERILEKMTTGELAVYTTWQPTLETKKVIYQWCDDLFEYARRKRRFLPLRHPHDYDRVVQLIMDRFKEEYDFFVDGLRKRKEHAKQRELMKTLNRIKTMQLEMAQWRRKIEEFSQNIQRTEELIPSLQQRYELMQLEMEAEPEWVPPPLLSPPAPATLLDLLMREPTSV